jgi:hypothetical protein
MNECPISWCTDYSITPAGEVLSLKRGRCRRLRPKPHPNGYLAVTLCRDGEHRDFLIHRLVAMHFLPNPHGFGEVNHIDGDKQNNAVTNLEWVNRSRNTKHSWDSGLRESQRLAVSQANADRCSRPVIGFGTAGILRFPSMTAAEAHGFSHSSISLCVAGKRKTHKGYRWEAA